jgi:hypothetical protein
VDPRSGQALFGGHRVCYRLADDGPPSVLAKPHRRPKDYIQLRLLSARLLVVQVEPLGFGDSDRPADYPLAGLREQVLSVPDRSALTGSWSGDIRKVPPWRRQ